MGVPDSKNIFSSFWLPSGESWSVYSSKNSSGYTPQMYSYDEAQSNPFLLTYCYANGKSKFSSDDYLLYALETVAQDSSINNPTPVLMFGPNQTSDQVTSLPYNGSILESVVAARINFDPQAQQYFIWYLVYGWTNSNSSNNNWLASYVYDDNLATTFDPTNWWVVPQADLDFPVYRNASLVLLSSVGSKYDLFNASTDGGPYLIFDFPTIAQTFSSTGDTCCVRFVQASSLTPDPTTGFYPGSSFLYNPKNQQWLSVEDCWIVNAN